MWPSTRISSGLKLRRRDNFHLLRYFEVFGRHSLRHERLYETECGGLWGKGKPSVRPLRKSCHPVQNLFIDPDTNSSSVPNRFQSWPTIRELASRIRKRGSRVAKPCAFAYATNPGIYTCLHVISEKENSMSFSGQMRHTVFSRITDTTGNRIRSKCC